MCYDIYYVCVPLGNIFPRVCLLSAFSDQRINQKIQKILQNPAIACQLTKEALANLGYFISFQITIWEYVFRASVFDNLWFLPHIDMEENW